MTLYALLRQPINVIAGWMSSSKWSALGFLYLVTQSPYTAMIFIGRTTVSYTVCMLMNQIDTLPSGSLVVSSIRFLLCLFCNVLSEYALRCWGGKWYLTWL